MRFNVTVRYQQYGTHTEELLTELQLREFIDNLEYDGVLRIIIDVAGT
jgi:hypothetical protein